MCMGLVSRVGSEKGKAKERKRVHLIAAVDNVEHGLSIFDGGCHHHLLHLLVKVGLQGRPARQWNFPVGRTLL